LVAVVEGGIATSQALLSQKFDHIFFTGSSKVGKIVMAAAAQHLTPVTLELGGKSPCVVEADCDLEVTAKRIASGKFFNAGQTCIAPDYVLVDQTIKAPLLAKLKALVEQFYTTNAQTSNDYARIISAEHCQRLQQLIENAQASPGAEIVTGGEVDLQQRYVSPTIVDAGALAQLTVAEIEADLAIENVKDPAGAIASDQNNFPLSPPRLSLMQEEIFGPILPVLGYTNLNEAIAFINSHPKPLALYFFSSDQNAQRQILRSTSSGAVCLNDTVSHYLVPQLPFGGVGNSGMGKSHGKYSFDAFSHHKAVFDRPTWFDVFLRYPPYKSWSIKVFRSLL
jgi:aldehyde dehydrogenase (NAD+)